MVEEPFELGREVALVRDDRLGGGWTAGEEPGFGFEEITGNFTFIDFGIRERERDGQPSGGADQMQTQAPEPAGMARATSRPRASTYRAVATAGT